jgi:hypothetical protein
MLDADSSVARPPHARRTEANSRDRFSRGEPSRKRGTSVAARWPVGRAGPGPASSDWASSLLRPAPRTRPSPASKTGPPTRRPDNWSTWVATSFTCGALARTVPGSDRQRIWAAPGSTGAWCSRRSRRPHASAHTTVLVSGEARRAGTAHELTDRRGAPHAACDGGHPRAVCAGRSFRWAARTPRCSPAGMPATWRAWCCSTRPRPRTWRASSRQRSVRQPTTRAAPHPAGDPVHRADALARSAAADALQHLAAKVQQEMKALSFRSTASHALYEEAADYAAILAEAVGTAPRQPNASAPRVSNVGKQARRSAVSLGAGTGAGRRRRAAGPSRRARFSH